MYVHYTIILSLIFFVLDSTHIVDGVVGSTGVSGFGSLQPILLPTSKFDNVPPQGTDRSFRPLFYHILIIFKKFTNGLYC